MWVTPNTAWGIAPAGPTSNVYNNNNQASTLSYDGSGRVTSTGSTSFSYDAENRQTQATDAPGIGGGTVTYAYDGAGERVKKQISGGAATIYVHDAFGQLAAEYSIAQNTAPCVTCYVVSDHLGSTRLLTDQNGNVVARHDFQPFGEEIQANQAGRGGFYGSTTDVEQKFTGQLRDAETGNDYFNARYYMPTYGRFMSPDPANAGADILNPQSWNGYGYVLGNPLNGVDPSGRDANYSGIQNGFCPPSKATCPMTGTPIVGTPTVPDEIGEAEARYASQFQWQFKGTLYGKPYNQAFTTLDAYFDWRTGIAVLPESKAYAAYMLDCAHSMSPCMGNDPVTTRYQGPTGNYALVGSALDPNSVSGMIPDPSFTSNFMHGGASWYTWNLIDTGHVATNVSGFVESHYDAFNAVLLTPLHVIFDVLPSFFINPRPGVSGPTYTCSPIGGCH